MEKVLPYVSARSRWAARVETLQVQLQVQVPVQVQLQVQVQVQDQVQVQVHVRVQVPVPVQAQEVTSSNTTSGRGRPDTMWRNIDAPPATCNDRKVEAKTPQVRPRGTPKTQFKIEFNTNAWWRIALLVLDAFWPQVEGQDLTFFVQDGSKRPLLRLRGRV